jgi:hypothetical protein
MQKIETETWYVADDVSGIRQVQATTVDVPKGFVKVLVGNDRDFVMYAIDANWRWHRKSREEAEALLIDRLQRELVVCEARRDRYKKILDKVLSERAEHVGG